MELRGKGRHDPCVLPRAIPMVEAMVSLVLVDHLMMQKAQCELFPNEAPLENQPNPMGKTARREGGPHHASPQIDADNLATAGGVSKPISNRVDEE